MDVILKILIIMIIMVITNMMMMMMMMMMDMRGGQMEMVVADWLLPEGIQFVLC